MFDSPNTGMPKSYTHLIINSHLKYQQFTNPINLIVYVDKYNVFSVLRSFLVEYVLLVVHPKLRVYVLFKVIVFSMEIFGYNQTCIWEIYFTSFHLNQSFPFSNQLTKFIMVKEQYYSSWPFCGQHSL